MNQQDAINKDKILQYLDEISSKTQFPYCKDIAKELSLDQSSVVTYCQEMDERGHVKFNNNLQGGDVKLNDSGIHFMNNGGYTKEYEASVKVHEEETLDKLDQRKTNRITRITSIIAIIISIAALAITIFF